MSELVAMAISSSRPVSMISPPRISAPVTRATCIARASFGWPSMVIARCSISSARKPSVFVFAMLLAIARCRSIEACIPESAV